MEKILLSLLVFVSFGFSYSQMFPFFNNQFNQGSNSQNQQGFQAPNNFGVMSNFAFPNFFPQTQFAVNYNPWNNNQNNNNYGQTTNNFYTPPMSSYTTTHKTTYSTTSKNPTNIPTRPSTPRSTQKTRPTSPQSNRIEERISQTKCISYYKESKKQFEVSSLAGDSVAHTIQGLDCKSSVSLVVGGVDASPGEFPHMAAIGYPDLNGQISFKCGGSLISEFYVLTAAHCHSADRTKPTVVRLGDHNLKVKDFGLPEEDFPIESFIRHENYNKLTTENDIALIKLRKRVIFGDKIRPACLDQSNFVDKTKATATGWGYLETGGPTSDVLQKVELDLFDNQKCRDLYGDAEYYPVFSSQLCAGVIKGGKDTCGGDSGGPLQVKSSDECNYVVIGITSYGPQFCGTKNSPGIYTRVSSYLEWIEREVWGST